MKFSFFVLKIIVIFIVGLICPVKQICFAYHYDTFNVFHWDNIRFTSAEPNKNFVKTQYIIHNPKKFNAFIFGSSRVGAIPPNHLPNENDGISLNWYNMTCSEAIPKEHFLTLKTFLKNKVDVKVVMIGFDSITMYSSSEQHSAELLRMQYQIYEKNKFNFYKPYLATEVDSSIIKQIDEYNFEAHKEDSEKFYSFGGWADDLSIPDTVDLSRYEAGTFGYYQKDSYKDLEEIVDLCAENEIKLILFTNPMHQNL